MKHEGGNIYSVFDELLPRESKEEMLHQKAKVIWMTGLSGSGKTTLAKSLEQVLHEHDFLTQLLDGDNIRTGINKGLGFSHEDRKENIRRIAEVSKLFLNCGIITINCFVSPTHEIRKQAREIIGEEDFIELFIDTPLAVCEQRDTKGLYAKARAGEIKNFTGISAPFESPKKPALRVETENKSVDDVTLEVLEFILPMIKGEDHEEL